MSEILSQKEIDALLSSVNEGGIAPEQARELGDDYERYDLTSGIRLQGWMHDIKIVDERIQSHLSINLLGLLHKSVEVKRQDIQIAKFGDYIKTLEVPSSVNSYALEGLSGYATLVLDASLVFALVNIFFGGGARSVQVKNREFTYTEQRVIQLILKTIVDSIKSGWKPLANVEFNLVESEMNPQAVSAYTATDILMVRTFKLNFEGGGGEVQLLMPGAVIDSIFLNRSKSMEQNRMSPEEIFRLRARRFLVDVTGELSGARLNVSELFKLASGDIIPVDSPEKVDVKVNGVTKFKARMGEVGGKVGLKILP